MFQQAVPEYRNCSSCLHIQSTHAQLESSIQRDPSLRKRLHQLMSETFELKQTISTLQMELKRVTQEQQELKGQLREALDEITANDHLMEGCKCRQEQQRAAASHLREQLQRVMMELESERGAVGELTEHNRSLQTQNELLAQIKQKYHMDLSRVKLQLDHYKIECERLMGENQYLLRENQGLSGEVEMLRQQVSSRRRQIEQYQTFVLQRIGAAKKSPQFHEECVQQRDRIYCKYLKYKQRSRMVGRQRDKLLFHLSEVSRQVEGGSSGR